MNSSPQSVGEFRHGQIPKWMRSGDFQRFQLAETRRLVGRELRLDVDLGPQRYSRGAGQNHSQTFQKIERVDSSDHGDDGFRGSGASSHSSHPATSSPTKATGQNHPTVFPPVQLDRPMDHVIDGSTDRVAAPEDLHQRQRTFRHSLEHTMDPGHVLKGHSFIAQGSPRSGYPGLGVQGSIHP